MVPKLPAKDNGKGASFRGAHQYYGHDKGADTKDRVEWTATRNLSTENPDLAWRIMAATALDRDRLKANAGIRNTGRKSDLVVFHFSLAWHPEQKGSLTRSDMEAACDEAMAAIGASAHQATFYAHNDEPHPHVHLLINRVSIEDGRLLSDSKVKLKLSQWAEAYERDHGKIYCEQRVVNNELRREGQYVRGEKEIPRHIFEAVQDLASNDNQLVAGIAAQQKAKDRVLALRGRNMAKLHLAAWQSLEASHKSRKAGLKRQLARERETVRSDNVKAYGDKLLALKRRQAQELATFEALETSLFGRTGNALRTSRELIGNTDDVDRSVIARTFSILTNAGKRKSYFDQMQRRERLELKRHYVQDVKLAYGGLDLAYKEKLAAARSLFESQRHQLSQRQSAENATLKKEWALRNAERADAIDNASKRAAFQNEFKEARGTAKDDQDAISLYRSAFDEASREKAAEQDNELDRDFDITDDD